MRRLYIECNSGISGDMTVAALIGLGVDEDWIRQQLSTLGINDEYEIHIYDTLKNGLLAKRFEVLYGEELAIHHHSETIEHEHEHHHIHRNIDDILNIINSSGIPENAKKLAVNIFNIIAEAEAKVHGVPVKEVHFHEVGAIDSIIDIVATALCIDYLKPDNIVFSAINEGSGSIQSSHGIIPVPVPATAEILSNTNLKLKIIDCNTELVTPTGAAIAAALCSKTGDMELILNRAKIGCGAGKKDFEWANILRAFLWDEDEKSDELILIETNIDDCSPEVLAYTLQILLEEGVNDSYFTPIYMKKGRPAYMLSVICRETDKNHIAELIFRHTTSIGIRIQPITRIVMNRTSAVIHTSFGDIMAKKCIYNDIVRIYPEYESVKEAAEKFEKPLTEIYKAFDIAVNK